MPVEASAEEEFAFLRLALEEAVELRRRSNQLGEAAGRLHIVLREESSAHLISAANLYGRLADRPYFLPATKWSERRAWSIVSHADNLRALGLRQGAAAGARGALL